MADAARVVSEGPSLASPMNDTDQCTFWLLSA
jgi:hypothetical protein